MVDKETHSLDAQTITLPIRDAQITRNGDGSWSMVLDVNHDIQIDETRAVKFYGELRIKGRQTGRKARTYEPIKG